MLGQGDVSFVCLFGWLFNHIRLFVSLFVWLVGH